jgi:hypothetical protein
MTAAAALARAQAAGLTLTVDGDRLRWRGPQPSAELLATLRAHKPELLALLAANDAPAATPGRAASGALVLQPAIPEQAKAERADREAIAEVDGGASPARWKLADHMRHAEVLRQIQRAALMRPPSWPDTGTPPTLGAFCSCCGGRRWWRERGQPRGWRCATCHPADHLPPSAVIEVGT